MGSALHLQQVGELSGGLDLSAALLSVASVVRHLRGTVAVKHQNVIAVAIPILIALVIVVLAWLITFPRVADNPTADRTAVGPSASPAIPAAPSVGRPSRNVVGGQRHSDADRDRHTDRDRDTVLGVLMLFLAGQQHTQAP
jgi:hypothetical protein